MILSLPKRTVSLADGQKIAVYGLGNLAPEPWRHEPPYLLDADSVQIAVMFPMGDGKFFAFPKPEILR